MTQTVRIDEKLKAKGHEVAEELRSSFRRQGIFVVNLIGSPGAGKTSLLECMAPEICARAGVIEGDLATDEDKTRAERAGLRAFQINTVGACHLDAGMVRNALAQFSIDNLDLLFIENVGNLVCPASFEIGEDIKVVLVSVAEGDDKPAKYPSVMRVASAFVITKVDLLPYVSCDIARVRRDAQTYRCDMPIFVTSAKTGEGVREFLGWIEERARKRRASDAAQGTE
jgi:hydrogenase nickel incorporation protein HypB